MTHKIQSVKPLENLTLSVLFQNGVEKHYDTHILFSMFPRFKEFEKDKTLFSKVQVDASGYGISWNDDLDLDAEDIWENGTENTHMI